MKVDKSKWRKATLKDICQIVHGKDHKAINNPNGTFPIYGSGGLSISGEKKSLEVDEIVIQEFCDFIRAAKSYLTDDVIIIGDLNSNVIFDKVNQRTGKTHSIVIEELRQIGIEDMYHHLTGEEQGKEQVPTF